MSIFNSILEELDAIYDETAASHEEAAKDFIVEMVQEEFETGNSALEVDELTDILIEEGFDATDDVISFYYELHNYGPAGFYEKYKDSLDFDPSFVAEYGDAHMNESLKESEETDSEDEEVDEEIIDDESEESEEVDTDDAQAVIECPACGGIVIKEKADIKYDEKTDLVNVGEECQYCEATDGFKLLGDLIPVAEAEEAEEAEEIDEVEDVDSDETVEDVPDETEDKAEEEAPEE